MDFTVLADVNEYIKFNDDRLILLYDILLNVLINQIRSFFVNSEDSIKCKEDLIIKFNIIKYGITSEVSLNALSRVNVKHS